MNRLAVLLQNKAPRLKGEVRGNVVDGKEVWPDFRLMLTELKEFYSKRDLIRQLGINESTFDHINMIKGYWNVSYKQGVRLMNLYDEITKKPIPYL